jgi:hypothetical protein
VEAARGDLGLLPDLFDVLRRINLQEAELIDDVKLDRVIDDGRRLPRASERTDIGTQGGMVRDVLRQQAAEQGCVVAFP